MTAQMIPEFYPDKPGRLQVRCKVEEGDMTVAESNNVLGSDVAYSFTSELKGPKPGVRDGDQVVAVGRDAAGNLIVRKRAVGDPQPIGEVITERVDFVGVPTVELGTYTSGTYERREATILLYGQRIRSLNVYVAQSDNLAVMDFLKACSVDGYPNCYQESTTMTSRIALETVTASTSAASTVKIAVLEGFEVGTSDLT